MKRMIAAAVAILASVVLLALAGCEWNYEYVDLNYGYDYAYISLPDGSCVQGAVESWRDYEDGDQLQIRINGVTYLTDTTRAVLVQH